MLFIFSSAFTAASAMFCCSNNFYWWLPDISMFHNSIITLCTLYTLLYTLQHSSTKLCTKLDCWELNHHKIIWLHRYIHKELCRICTSNFWWKEILRHHHYWLGWEEKARRNGKSWRTRLKFGGKMGSRKGKSSGWLCALCDIW